MVDDWGGEKGRFWAEHAEWFTRMLAGFAPPVIAGAALQPGERVLDVGCGCGDLSLAAAEAVGPTGSVVGVDLSVDELGVAADRAAGVDQLSFELGDAGAVELAPPFDALISRFGVMFFGDPVGAFTHLRSLLGDDGRLAFVAWTRPEANRWIAIARDAITAVVPPAPPPPPDAPGPFAFADGDRVRTILGGAGFSDVVLEEVEADVDFGPDAAAAVEFVHSMEWVKETLAPHPEDRQQEALSAIEAAVADHLGPDGVRLPGVAWLVRAHR